VIAKFSGHAVTLRSSPTVFAVTLPRALSIHSLLSNALATFGSTIVEPKSPLIQRFVTAMTRLQIKDFAARRRYVPIPKSLV
jgi:hypothetical protein